MLDHNSYRRIARETSPRRYCQTGKYKFRDILDAISDSSVQLRSRELEKTRCSVPLSFLSSPYSVRSALRSSQSSFPRRATVNLPPLPNSRKPKLHLREQTPPITLRPHNHRSRRYSLIPSPPPLPLLRLPDARESYPRPTTTVYVHDIKAPPSQILNHQSQHCQAMTQIYAPALFPLQGAKSSFS